MKVVEGNFGKKDSGASIPSSEFLSKFAIKALDHEEKGRKVKVAVVMYEDGEMFEVASNEQYPDGCSCYYTWQQTQSLTKHWE